MALIPWATSGVWWANSFPAMSLWGYAPLAIALGLMPFALEAFETLLALPRGHYLTVKLTLRRAALTPTHWVAAPVAGGDRAAR